MTAEEAIVITIASIVARHSQSVIWKGVWKARVQFKCRAQEALAATRDRVWKGVERGRVEFVASQVPKAGSFDRLRTGSGAPGVKRTSQPVKSLDSNHLAEPGSRGKGRAGQQFLEFINGNRPVFGS